MKRLIDVFALGSIPFDDFPAAVEKEGMKWKHIELTFDDRTELTYPSLSLSDKQYFLDALRVIKEHESHGRPYDDPDDWEDAGDFELSLRELLDGLDRYLYKFTYKLKNRWNIEIPDITLPFFDDDGADLGFERLRYIPSRDIFVICSDRIFKKGLEIFEVPNLEKMFDNFWVYEKIKDRLLGNNNMQTADPEIVEYLESIKPPHR